MGQKSSAIPGSNQYVAWPSDAVIDMEKGTNIVEVNEDGTALMQVKHGFLSVGESIAQIKCSTTARVTANGQIAVAQFKQEISSRGEEVWYYKNSIGTFTGSLAEAQAAFPDVAFSELKIPPQITLPNPEVPAIASPSQAQWQTLNEFDAEKEGGPTNWKKWLDATQTALDIAGMIPAVGEIADCINGVVSLARGDYLGAALSFASMVPVIGGVITAGKLAKKASRGFKDIEGVYDLIVKNGKDIQGYVGQSKNTFKRIKQHWGSKGKLKHTIKQNEPTIHRMPGSKPNEREIYEQFVILKRYGGDISKKGSNEFHKLINKVHPVGGRFDLKTPAGLQEFYKEANKIAQKYKLPTTFPNF